MKKILHSYPFGMLLSLLGGTMWGLAGICAQYVFAYNGASSNWMTPCRLMGSGILLLIWCYGKEGSRIFAVFQSKQSILQILQFSIFGMALCQAMYFLSIEQSNAATATVLQYLSPSLTLLWVSFRQKKLPSLVSLLGVGLSIFGTVLLATHGDFHQLSISGIALIAGLLSAIGLSVYSIQPQALMQAHGTFVITGWGALLGGGMVALLFRPWAYYVPLSKLGWLSFAVSTILGGMVAYCAFSQGVRILGPAMGSLLACIEPAASLLFSVILFDARFQKMDWVGFLCILATIILLAVDKTIFTKRRLQRIKKDV